MKRFWLMAALGTATLASCGDYQSNEQAYNESNAAYGAGEAEGNGAAKVDYASRPATTLPEGTRVVVEEGVRYRIDPGGARIRLGDEDSVIFVEDGVRYRLDPDRPRFRVDEQGIEIRTEDVDVQLDPNR